MKILIVDDSIDKLDDVSRTLISAEKETKITIDTAEDIQGALSFLKTSKVDLLILDQCLPQRKGQEEEVLVNGGEILLREIRRKAKKLNPPKYIVGLTQFYEDQNHFSNIWSLLKYSPGKLDWSISLQELVNHINSANDLIPSVDNGEEILPTVFFEGLTDLSLFKKIVELDFPELQNQICLKSQKNAGANWVAQQLVVWGHTLPKNKGNDVKALGVFDSDQAGIKARTDVLKKLSTANQQNNCKNIVLLPKYSEDLVKFYRIGMQLEIETESLLPLSILLKADRAGWLEFRNPPFLVAPKNWNPMLETIPDFLKRNDIPEEFEVYLKKVKIKSKTDLVEMVMRESEKDNSVLKNLRAVAQDVITQVIDQESFVKSKGTFSKNLM